MDKWVRNAIGLAFVAILLVVAWKLYDGSGGEVTVWDFSVKVDKHGSSVEVETQTEPSEPDECRLPAHGIEEWTTVDTVTMDSGWRKGGSSPGEFCAAQKSALQAQESVREVVLLSTNEKHKSQYTPFKHDYYRYACLFEIREPVYRMAPNTACPN